MNETALKTNDEITWKQDSEKNLFPEHLRLCIDWCADDLIFSDCAVSSIEEGIEKASTFEQYEGDIYIYKSITLEIVHWIQKVNALSG